MLAAQSDPSELTGLVGWVAEVIAALGSVGVALLTLLDNFFPPVPSEVVLPLAGYLVSQDRLTLIGALVASTAGSVVGAIVLYWLGQSLGRQRLNRVMMRIPLVRLEDLDQARDWFDRHGRGAVFFGRMVPGVRSLISIPAGAERMPWPSFIVATTLGSLAWNAALVGGGYALGRQWRSIGAYSDYLNYGLIAALIIATARFVWKRRERLRART
jgi:membrane protein DedA with SNARE-associated domain